MFNTRMLSGNELVAKGATKKIDGKLPELGSKEVSPSGSWLEQKQIQSALEARKHLIEVERIEKNGSLSHAVWNDELKLAEVTKKSGSHWQFIGHNIGKHLYLLPEEALFLIEVNCLLLKHNEVTVSLQKAYCLCLNDEISITQYKVYASLSRLGYRVFRHKEPIVDSKSNIPNTFKENIIVTLENYPQTSHTVPIVKEQVNSSIANNLDETIDSDCADENQKIEHIDDAKFEICSSVSDRVTDDELIVKNEIHVLYPDQGDSLASLIEEENIKVESEINNSTGVMLQSSKVDPRENENKSDETSSIHKPVHNESSNTNYLNGCISTDDKKNKAENQKTEILTHSKMEVDNINESVMTENNNIRTATQEINMSTLKENGIHNNVNENSITDENCEAPAAMPTNNSNERNGTTIDDIVYSVDESGVIRVLIKDEPMDIDAESNISNAGTATNSNIAENAAPGSCTNGYGITHYDAEINHYEAKMQTLAEKKSNAGQKTDLEGLNTLQDFYHTKVVSVNVPEEKYLPRNIFLHKTAYVINLDVIRKQNAKNANVSSDEMDLHESTNRASRGTDAPSLTDLPRFVPQTSLNNAHIRYPYRPFERTPPHWNSRINYNSYYNYNMFRPPYLQDYFIHPRHRFQPQPFIRHSMNYNLNAPGASAHNQAHRQNETLKMFHYEAILHIASRFKKGVGRCVQIQALNNLLCTYNARYSEHLELTRDFDIVIKEVPTVRDVIVLDEDEPKCKKVRLNDDTEKINENKKRLRELAAKLKDLHAKNLAVSRHRRVFSNAIKTFNKSFNADLYLDANFEIKDRKLIILDSSSDSDVVVTVKEKSRSKKGKRLKNPYSILKLGLNNINVGASTSREVPVLQTLSLNVINDASTSTNITESNIDTPSPKLENTGEGLLKYFDKAWLPSDEDFGSAALCSREIARLDSHLFEAEYLYDVIKDSVGQFENWIDLKLAVLKDILQSLDIQKQQAEALSNDFLMETESQMKPILGSKCADLKTALKQLAIIPTNKEIPTETNLRIHFDVCNRNIHFKKSNPPRPNFRVICCDESAAFPSSNDVVAVQAKYDDAVPTVFAFVGTSGSISYLQINSIDLPVFLTDNELT